MTERDKSLIKFYSKVKNIGLVASEFNVSRQRVHQVLMRNGVAIEKRGKQGQRALSTGT